MDIFEHYKATPENPNGFSRAPIPEITEYMSYSRAKTMALSMADYKMVYIDGNKPDDTVQKQFGRLGHKMLLEPDLFRRNYVITPDKDDLPDLIDTIPDLKKVLEAHRKIPTKWKKVDMENALVKIDPFNRSKIWRFILEDHFKNLTDESISVTKSEADLILSMITAIDEKFIGEKRARDLLINGEGEVCAYWEDPEFGVTWFIRLDYIRTFSLPGDRWLFWITDLKTTKNASYEGFKKEIATFFYHYQSWIYRRVVRGITGMKVNITTIAVEKKDPIGVGVYEPESKSDETAAWEIRRLLDKWRWCQGVGRWPKYEERVIHQGPPNWYYYNVEEKADMEDN